MAQSQGTASLGSYLSFSSVLPADEAAATYAALTYVESDEETSLGDFGGTSEVITYNTIKNGLVNKRLGATDSGQMAAEFAFVSSNAGQQLLQTAAKTKQAIAVRETLSSGDIFYYIAYVSNAIVSVGDSSTITMLKCNFEITSEIVEG